MQVIPLENWTTLGNIGDLSFQLENNTKALEYFQRGMHLQAKRRMKRNVEFHNSTAIVYSHMGDVASLFHFSEALKIYKQTGDKVEALMVRTNIGSLLMDQKRFNEALAYYQVLLQDSDTSDDVVMGAFLATLPPQGNNS